MTARCNRTQQHRQYTLCTQGSQLPCSSTRRLIIIACDGPETSQVVHVKRSGCFQKVAVSRFGEPRLRLSNSTSTAKKVRLAEGVHRPQYQPHKATDESNSQQQQSQEASDSTSSSPVRPQESKPKPQLTGGEAREELVEMRVLYDVGTVHQGIDIVTPGAPWPASTQRRRKLQEVMPNGPDDRHFSAAGVVAISFAPSDGHIRLLLTQERAQKSEWHKKLVRKDMRNGIPYNLPGGKRKIIDIDPQATALRELSEETAGLLTADSVELAQTAIFYGAHANYYAFLCHIQGQEDLPERFAELIAAPPKGLAPCRTKALAWVPVRNMARWPRSNFLDRLLCGTSIPAWLVAQQRAHDQRLADAAP